MCSIIRAFLLFPLLYSACNAHSMTPGFETVATTTNSVVMQYELSNAYSFAAVYEIFVVNKDGSIYKDWDTPHSIYKLNPGSKRNVTITFNNVLEQRKVMVCTKLIGVTRNESPPKITSVVCSRLIINKF